MDTPAHYRELALALRERLTVIADREGYAQDQSAHLERLRAASEKIAALRDRLQAPIDPRLAHYLDRCSYGKALELVEAAI